MHITPHHIRISAEEAMPCLRTQHSNMIVFRRVVLFVDSAADQRRDPEQREEVAGRKDSMHLLGVSIHHQRDHIWVKRGICRDLCKGTLLCPPILIVRISGLRATLYLWVCFG